MAVGPADNDKAPEELTFAARPQHLADVRRLVGRLASGVALRRDQVEDFLTAVDEAVANAIRHGSPHGPDNRVRVTCRHVPPDEVVVEVEDQGGGFAVPVSPAMPSPEAPGGRGLPLMCALADAVEVSSGDGGTRVTLKKKAPGAAAADKPR